MSIDGLLKSRSGREAGQLKAELDWLCGWLRLEKVRTYLEVGARNGDTVWYVAQHLPANSRIVAVDWPAQVGGHKRSEKFLSSAIDSLRIAGFDAHVIYGDSHSAATKSKVWALGPFDCGLIDGDHAIAGVAQDWDDYGPLCRMMALHDINWKRGPGWAGDVIGVPEFWQRVKGAHERHAEIAMAPDDCGIGLIWK